MNDKARKAIESLHGTGIGLIVGECEISNNGSLLPVWVGSLFECRTIDVETWGTMTGYKTRRLVARLKDGRRVIVPITHKGEHLQDSANRKHVAKLLRQLPNPRMERVDWHRID
jgi:hypothetical protein